MKYDYSKSLLQPVKVEGNKVIFPNPKVRMQCGAYINRIFFPDRFSKGSEFEGEGLGNSERNKLSHCNLGMNLTPGAFAVVGIPYSRDPNGYDHVVAVGEDMDSHIRVYHCNYGGREEFREDIWSKDSWQFKAIKGYGVNPRFIIEEKEEMNIPAWGKTYEKLLKDAGIKTTPVDIEIGNMPLYQLAGIVDKIVNYKLNNKS